MSTSAIDVNMKQVNTTVQQNNLPKWLDNFLVKSFFRKCPADHGLPKKDLNRYCITCDASTCKECVASGHHNKHELLIIYRHVKQNVVLIDQMGKYIDCKKIQHYKCNKKLVISLTPLPHNGSGALIDGDGACRACKRKLTDRTRFHFCSIMCKILARNKNSTQPSTSSTSGVRDTAERPINYRKRSRKGVPRRAPLF